MEKVHHVFDSFEGLSAPSDQDGSYWTRGDLAAEEVTIRENLKEFDFVTYYRGWIPTRFKEVEDRRFVFVHLDLDLYQPTGAGAPQNAEVKFRDPDGVVFDISTRGWDGAKR